MDVILNRRIIINGLVVFTFLSCNYLYGKHLLKNEIKPPEKVVLTKKNINNKKSKRINEPKKQGSIKKSLIKSKPIVKKTNPHDNIKKVQNKKDILFNNNRNNIKIIATFYGEGDDENGKGRGLCNAYGKRLRYGCIALPRDMKLGTKIYIKELNHTFVGMDRGNRRFIRRVGNNTIRIDMFIPRRNGESLRRYKKRISDMGIKKYNGLIVK